MILFSGFRRPRRAGATLIGAGLLALTSVLPVTAERPLADPGRPAVMDDELLVKFRPGTPSSTRAAAHQQAGGQVAREIVGLGVTVVSVGPAQAQRKLATYEQNPNVEYAELNGIAYTTAVPNDPRFAEQWALHNTGQNGGIPDRDIDAPEAWDLTRGGAGTTIAVLDSGITTTKERVGRKQLQPHPDVAGKVVESRNWTTSSRTTNDVYNHGTHVAGIAAAMTGNGAGVAGVCPNCKLINGKVLGDDGGGAYDWIASGVLWAAGCEIRTPADAQLADQRCVDGSGAPTTPRAQVLNLSLGGTYDSTTLRDAVTVAARQGTLVACAAGNNGSNGAFYPAAYDACLAVGATDRADLKASWSNYGATWVDVAAPGVSILSTVNSGGYEAWNGTSIATPHVAGLAALLTSRGMTGADARTRIETTTDITAGTGSHWAHGRINACRAVGGGC